jgi:hypothetical protein
MMTQFAPGRSVDPQPSVSVKFAVAAILAMVRVA